MLIELTKRIAVIIQNANERSPCCHVIPEWEAGADSRPTTRADEIGKEAARPKLISECMKYREWRRKCARMEDSASPNDGPNRHDHGDYREWESDGADGASFSHG
jgi:hypothetical protein